MHKAWIWLDRLLLPLLFGVLLYVGLRRDEANGPAGVIWSDAEGYYLYLPATVIYGSWQNWDGQDGLRMLSCCSFTETDIVKTRYTYGVAALQLPFFLGAHAWATTQLGPGTPPPADHVVQSADPNTVNLHDRKYTALRGQATGFSDVYGRALHIAAAFYATLGLALVRKRLRANFGAPVATLTAVLVLLATNLYYYAVAESGMSHAYSFFLFAAFAWLAHLWMQRPRWSVSLGLGACLAFIFLIRPTNLIVALLLVLWEVKNWADFKANVKMWRQNGLQIVAMVAMAMLTVVPQLFYWHYAFGEWLVWSYEGEGFSNALQPKVLQVLFSYQNGLFLYTPIMLLAVAGIFVGWRSRTTSALANLLIFLLATYTFASWWAWWFGAAFGHRCFVEYYALLAVPLAVVVRWVWENEKQWLRWLGMAAFACFVLVNLKMVLIYQPPWDGENWHFSNYFGILKNALHIWRW